VIADPPTAAPYTRFALGCLNPVNAASTDWPAPKRGRRQARLDAGPVLRHDAAMTPASRLGRQLQEILAGLDRIGAPSALIGGLAMAPHNVVRATQDVDLLHPRRTQDLEDIRALLKANADRVDVAEVRDFFRLFGREALLDEILDPRS
jgi:hypothetical protein